MSYWHQNPFDDEGNQREVAQLALHIVQVFVFALALLLLLEVA